MTQKRIPLTGVANTRPGTVAASGSSGVIGVGVIGIMVIGQSAAGSAKDHRLINCSQITEVDEAAQSKRLYVVKRPGFAPSHTPEAGSIGNAIHVWNGQGTGGKVMSAFGATNFTLYDSVTSKGSGTGKATGISETSISGTPTLFISSSDNTGWTYQDGGAATKITDVDFPGNASRTLAGTFAHLDGYPFIMDIEGRVYNGDLNSLTAWTAASFIKANSIPDVGVGCVRNRDTIVAFCKRHFDVFRNAGNPSLSPLARIDGYSQQIGCVSADAITRNRDTIYFVGTTDGANVGLYAYDVGQVKKVSTPEIEAMLAIAGTSNISTTTIGYYGRHFIYVIAGSSTYAYCVEENNWHEVSGPSRLWYKAAALQAGSTTVIYAISKISTSGKVYVLNPSNVVYQDDGMTYTATIQTTKWDGGTSKKKTMKRLYVVGDQEPTSSLLNIAWTDDDYQTFSTPRTVDLADERPNLTRCGRSSRRAFLLTHSANSRMRLEALEPEIEVGQT